MKLLRFLFFIIVLALCLNGCVDEEADAEDSYEEVVSSTITVTPIPNEDGYWQGELLLFVSEMTTNFLTGTTFPVYMIKKNYANVTIVESVEKRQKSDSSWTGYIVLDSYERTSTYVDGECQIILDYYGSADRITLSVLEYNAYSSKFSANNRSYYFHVGANLGSFASTMGSEFSVSIVEKSILLPGASGKITLVNRISDPPDFFPPNFGIFE